MKEIIDSIKPVIDNANFVSIDDNAIHGFIDSITDKDFEQTEFDHAPEIPEKTEENFIGFTIAYNAINYCYWGNPKWTIERGGEIYDGSYALTIAFIFALQEGYKLVDPKYLKDLSEKDLAYILRGNIEIPLFQERLQMLRKLGSYVLEKFDGSWMNIIKKANFDALELVKVLVSEMPDLFADELMYKDRPVKFYKRAQLVPSYIDHDLSKLGEISFKLSNMDQLTAFADYKVPQVLRKFGILKYTTELASKIDNMVEIYSGSDEEIEIRTFTIEAIDRITKKAKGKFPKATAARIDGILWFRGQKKSSDDKPYHKTKTIWY